MLRKWSESHQQLFILHFLRVRLRHWGVDKTLQLLSSPSSAGSRSLGDNPVWIPSFWEGRGQSPASLCSQGVKGGLTSLAHWAKNYTWAMRESQQWPRFKNLSFQQCKQYKKVSVTATTLELKYLGNSYFAHRWNDKISTKPRDTSVTNVWNNGVSPQNLHWKVTFVRKHIPCRRTPAPRDRSLIMAG